MMQQKYKTAIGVGGSAAAGIAAHMGAHELSDMLKDNATLAQYIDNLAPVAGWLATNATTGIAHARGYISRGAKTAINTLATGVEAAVLSAESLNPGLSDKYHAITGAGSAALYGLVDYFKGKRDKKKNIKLEEADDIAEKARVMEEELRKLGRTVKKQTKYTVE